MNRRHNHLTRDVKPKGECPRCDHYHEKVRQETEAESFATGYDPADRRT